MEPSSSSQSKGVNLRKKQLHCPFTWGTPIVPYEALEQEYDTLALAADTWAVIISKIFLAYQHVLRNDVARSKNLLVECYMPLLEVKGFVRNDSDLIVDYRTALKHVVDSSWAFVCCKNNPVKKVKSFLESITPYPTMTDCQKSAVWAIRGKLAHHEDGLRAAEVAISLNPNEGQWHMYRGLLLHQFRQGPYIESLEELSCLKNAFNLRPTAETMVVYGIALTALAHEIRKPTDVRDGLELLRDAVKLWPDNTYVNFECGVAFHKNLTKQEDLLYAEQCIRKAVRLLDPVKCKIVFTELGVLLVNYMDTAEGKKYLQMAKEVKH